MTAPPAKRRRPRKFHIGGQVWTVRIVPRTDEYLADEHDLNATGHDGCTVFADCVIAIAEDLSPEARQEVFVHELLHAINNVSGAKHEMGLRLRTDKAREEHEERIVRAQTPHLHRVLVDLGFRFPKGLLT